MRTPARIAALLAGAAVLGCCLLAWCVVRRGVSARDEPTAVEAFLARRLRHLAVPRGAREAPNPVPPADAVLAEARGHFADHCAACHGNDGRGDTPLGRNLYPKAPDMTSPGTQSLTDGEIFYIIHNGVRLTGMPAWGDGAPGDDFDSWKLVRFIRHLPQISPQELDEMAALNPRSPHEQAREEEIRKFLEGEDNSTEHDRRH